MERSMVFRHLMCHRSLTLMIFTLLVFISPPRVVAGQESAPSSTDTFTLPESFSLCGEPLPLYKRHVWEMLDQEFTIAIHDRAQVFLWLKRAGRYFPYIAQELEAAGMPADLKYLAVAESALRPYSRSPQGAVGIWQFIPKTGRRYKLKKNRSFDERRSLESATEAALAYLKDLNTMFKSWTLAMAAYNCGEERMEKEIQQQRVRSYYELNLPLETERFIYRIAAIKLIMENPERYGFHLAPENIYLPPEIDMLYITMDQALHITDFAEAIDSRFKVIKELNPHIKGYYLPPGTYRLKVPGGKKVLALEVINKLTRNEHAVVEHMNDTYVVKAGDSLSLISEKTGVPVPELQRINQLEDTTLTVGQELLISP